MTNILLNLLLLFILFSCSHPQKKQVDASVSLVAKEFIPELSGKLPENSGMMIYKDLYWGFNDSGGKNTLYAFDDSGKIRREVEIVNAKNKDWESIAQDSKHIYIGDFGNNMGSRENLRIYKIKKKDIKKKKEQKVEAKKIEFNYENQKRYHYFDQITPFDCEAMLTFQKNLYLFTKNWGERTTWLYKLPKERGDYDILPVDTFDVNGLVTGADLSRDKKKLALVGYQNHRSFIWLFYDFEGDNFFGGKSQYISLKEINGAQTEGVCFWGNDKLLVSCEKTNVFSQQVFLFDLNELKDGAYKDK